MYFEILYYTYLKINKNAVTDIQCALQTIRISLRKRQDIGIPSQEYLSALNIPT